MKAFIPVIGDEHRGAFGTLPICRVLPIAPARHHVARRLITPMRSTAGQPVADVRARNAGCGAATRNPAGVGRELSNLWDAQAVAAAVAGRVRGRPLHRRPLDARNEHCWRDQGKTRENHGQRLQSALSQGSRQSPVLGRASQRSTGFGFHPCRDLGRLCLCRVRRCARTDGAQHLNDRYLRPPDRRLARLPHYACEELRPPQSIPGPRKTLGWKTPAETLDQFLR